MAGSSSGHPAFVYDSASIINSIGGEREFFVVWRSSVLVS
jgi:hypothetical protein